MNSFFKKGLESVNFFTTYRCNSRCTNCFIWKGDDSPDKEPLSDEEIQRLFYDDPTLSRCQEIGFAGGEPTISPFFWRALDLVPDNRHITITTNALSSAKLIRTLNERPDRENFVIQVSMDGIGHVHDETRGIKGSYDKAIYLLERLRDLGVPRLISFTINPLNFHQLLSVYEIAEALGAKFSARMAYCGGAYENKQDGLNYSLGKGELSSVDYSIKKIIDSEIKKKDHSQAQVVFLSKIIDYCKGEQNDIACGALHTGTVIDLYGDVFPNCPVIMKTLGNLRENTFDDIWHGEKAEKIREHVRRFACGGCWNDCQVITNISNDKPFIDKNYCDIKLAPLLAHSGLKECLEISDLVSNDYLGTGWYPPEGQSDFMYRWTSQSFSLLVPEGTKSVEFFCMPAPFSGNDDGLFIEVRIDSLDSQKHIISSTDWHDMKIDFRSELAGNTICFFDMSHSYNPGTVGSGNDTRDLGMAIKSIKFIK